MFPALTLVLTLVGGFDVGGHVAGVYPVGSLGRYHGSAAMLGATAGWTAGRFRLSADYDYAGLPGRAALSYRAQLHFARAELGYAIVDHPGWSLNLLAGGGAAFAARRFGAGSETGIAPCAHWGFGLAQRSGASRVTLDFIHTMLASKVADRGLQLDHILGLRAGVSYAP